MNFYFRTRIYRISRIKIREISAIRARLYLGERKFLDNDS